MAEQNKESNYKIRNRDLGYKIRHFGKAGQVSARKLSETTGWVASVMFAERIGDTHQVKYTTFVVKDKEYPEAYQAKQFMKDRLAAIFPAQAAG